VKLEEYRMLKEKTYKELSEILEIPLPTVHRICKADGCSSLATANKIVKKTDGQVWFTDLVIKGDC